MFKYLKGIIDCGLWYLIGEDFMLVAYTNLDCVGNVDDGKV